MKKRIIWGIVCVCVTIAIILLFAPIKRKENKTMPAVIVSAAAQEPEKTSFVIEGTWSRPILSASPQSFYGKIKVDALDYTHRADGWELDFQITDLVSVNSLSGGFFYNSNSDFTGYGWLYTDPDHGSYVLITNHFYSKNSDYIVIAPAETEEEAMQICNRLGLNYLQDK